MKSFPPRDGAAETLNTAARMFWHSGWGRTGAVCPFSKKASGKGAVLRGPALTDPEHRPRDRQRNCARELAAESVRKTTARARPAQPYSSAWGAANQEHWQRRRRSSRAGASLNQPALGNRVSWREPPTLTLLSLALCRVGNKLQSSNP